MGRSTQIALLREWVESKGYAVQSTGLKRSDLAGGGIKEAMRGHTLGNLTTNLFYATDMVDRLEKIILPALRAGFVVLTDRYIYSIIARAMVRGVDPGWIRDVFGFALVPDAVFYLHADLPHLIPRVLNARGFDYWESGMDYLSHRDYYDAFVEYQTRLLAQFEAMVEEYDFHRIDATQSIREVFQELKVEHQGRAGRHETHLPARRREWRGRGKLERSWLRTRARRGSRTPKHSPETQEAGLSGAKGR